MNDSTQRRNRPALKWLVIAGVAVLIIAAAVGLTQCASKGDASSVMNRTFSEPHVYRSGKLTLDLRLEGKPLTGSAGPFRLALQGPFSSNGGGNVPSFALLIALRLGSNSSRLGLISNGKNAWMDLAGTAYTLPPSVMESFVKAYRTDPSKQSKRDSSPLERTGFKPLDWVKSSEVVGDEQVGNTQTVHVRASVDAPKMLADLSQLLGAARSAGGGLLSLSDLSAADAQKLGSSIDSAQVNIWSGKDDGALRRITIDLQTKPTKGASQARISLDLAMTELNTPELIEAPKQAKPFSELAALVSTLAGTKSGKSELDPKARSYEECVRKAANLDAAQSCRSLLTS